MPRAIGRYTIRRVIAHGGMGVVYEAVQDQPARSVALKVLKHGLASPEALRRFAVESRTLAKLHHPAIAQVYDAGTYDDGSGSVPFFAMEFIPNARSLIEYAGDEALSTRERIELFIRICEAIEHGHSRGIIHRDLKPDNLLVDEHGQPKVIDFGVARTTGADIALTTLQTDAGQLIGTLQYMSPEQVRARPEEIDSRSDVYSLGVVLFQLLTGTLPYRVADQPIHEASRIIREQSPRRPSTIQRIFSGDLETILLKAIEKDRDQRYRTVQDFREDLQRFLNNETIIARRPTLRYLTRHRTRKFLQRHPLTAVVGIALAAGLLALYPVYHVFNEWTEVNSWYGTWLMSVTELEEDIAQYEHTRIIRIGPQVPELAPQIAERFDVPGVTAEEWRSARRIHGKLMERLATARPRAVIWDLAFRNETPHDALFVDGVRALNEVGVDVAVGVFPWMPDEEGRPQNLSRNIAPHVRWGIPAAGITTYPTIKHELFVKRGVQDAWLSLTLVGAAAYLNPRWEPSLTLLPKKKSAVMAFYQRDGENPRVRRWHTEQWRVDVSEQRTVRSTDRADLAYGLAEGDFIGSLWFSMPPKAALNRSTVDYTWVFDATERELREAFEGKAVVLGDYRGVVDHHELPSGEKIHGCDIYSAGLDALLRESMILIQHRPVGFAMPFLAALVGAMIALIAGERWWRRLVLYALAMAATVLLSLIALAEWQYLVNPVAPSVALLVTGEATAFVMRVYRARPT